MVGINQKTVRKRWNNSSRTHQTYPTHPTYQTYQTYPTYPTYGRASTNLRPGPGTASGVHIPSLRATHVAAVRSPQTFTVVRDMSSRRSTPITIAIPSPGTPNIVNTPTSRGIDPPGTPAAPIAVITDMIMTAAICPSDRLTLKICARKITVMPSKIAVPFMHIVLPIGSTNPEMR